MSPRRLFVLHRTISFLSVSVRHWNFQCPSELPSLVVKLVRRWHRSMQVRCQSPFSKPQLVIWKRYHATKALEFEAPAQLVTNSVGHALPKYAGGWLLYHLWRIVLKQLWWLFSFLHDLVS